MEKEKEKGKMVSRGPGKGMDKIDLAKDRNLRGEAKHPGGEENAAGSGNSDGKPHDKYGSHPASDESIDRGED